MNIYVLVLNDVFDTGLSTLLDTFTTANELSESTAMLPLRATVTVAGVRRRVQTAQGLLVPVVAGRSLPRPDIVVVPALGFKTPPALRAALSRPDIAEAGQLLRDWAAQGAVVAGACTATFILAGAQLLDDQPATTSWWLAPLFRELYPRVHLDESRMLAESKGVVTAGAALAHLDLALWLIRRSSPALATLAARYLVMDPRPSQAAFVIPDHLAHSDPVVERFEHWARHNLAQGFSLKAAALAVGASERTLARRLQTVLGKSPLSYFQDLRVERAVHLLQTTNASVEQIAEKVGYADGVTLRTLLRRKIGRGARELRQLDTWQAKGEINEGEPGQ
ncbi:GlxA family transcriptional regulator [Chitinimonas sp. PSY-7]|uniref:helix-turn-helix domain-containing protein n=1 Tax=Chitinimonas sp. PSY-7 TaxID=3459088 RepID=UPI00403FC8F9